MFATSHITLVLQWSTYSLHKAGRSKPACYLICRHVAAGCPLRCPGDKRCHGYSPLLICFRRVLCPQNASKCCQSCRAQTSAVNTEPATFRSKISQNPLRLQPCDKFPVSCDLRLFSVSARVKYQQKVSRDVHVFLLPGNTQYSCVKLDQSGYF
jgi:hypothetical protein